MFGRTVVTSTELAFPWPDDELESKEDFFNKVWKWCRVARRLILSQQAKSKRAVDAYRKPAPVFHRGDLVVVYKKRRAEGLTKKLLPRAVGPYQVLKRISSVCYRLEDIPHNKRSRVHRIFNAHVSILKPYVARKETEWPSGDTTSDEVWDDTDDERDDPVDLLENEVDCGVQGGEEDFEYGSGEDFELMNEEPMGERLREGEGWISNQISSNSLNSQVLDSDQVGSKGQSPTNRVALPPSRSGRRRWINRWADQMYYDEHEDENERNYQS